MGSTLLDLQLDLLPLVALHLCVLVVVRLHLAQQKLPPLLLDLLQLAAGGVRDVAVDQFLVDRQFLPSHDVSSQVADDFAGVVRLRSYSGHIGLVCSLPLLLCYFEFDQFFAVRPEYFQKYLMIPIISLDFFMQDSVSSRLWAALSVSAGATAVKKMLGLAALGLDFKLVVSSRTCLRDFRSCTYPSI